MEGDDDKDLEGFENDFGEKKIKIGISDAKPTET